MTRYFAKNPQELRLSVSAAGRRSGDAGGEAVHIR
jgi:hypothetical protein